MNTDGQVVSLAEKLVLFQEKYHVTDAAISLASHLSVEKVHGIKMNKYSPDSDEKKLLLDFINNYTGNQQ
ncbi:LBP_cg2779 family protein [Liquorilactobacillus uvarum]|uniref:LBP_cg2779 family protein n=1 Tax=Liquorilactobacillus uvarum TaxID=303240 RepID=UPI00288B434F|nr:LBP_cg2779 family protein [Liquorilactobacillus uvarum]